MSKEFKRYQKEIAGRMLTVDINRVAAQANGAAFIKYGDTTVLSTCTASEKPRDGIDFFPLSVEYEEKLYSVGKIPGGFNKREGKASENAVLTSRVIDRPMRPLFPKDYRNDVTLNNLVMSVDPECRPELVAMLGSSIATCISDVPFDGPCAMTQVGLIDGEFIINPTQKQWDEGDLKLTVASTSQKVIMIEAGANIVPEAKMIEAIYMAHDINQDIIAFINEIVAEVGKPKHSYVSCAVPEELFAAIKEIVPPEAMEEAVFSDEKQVREENIRQITEKLEEAFADNEEYLAKLGEAVYQYQKKTVRKMILKDHKRPDGRAIDQIRPLAAEVDLIPRVHGSAMFTRGQTQICDVVTLAPLSEVQKIDGLDENEVSKRYMHHYNFPSYSVGETKPSRGPGRREIGHGNLAHRALKRMFPDNFPYTCRIVSDILESNGSSSMATVCGGTLSLLDAGVKMKRPVAGVAMGLISDPGNVKYAILSDILGDEDHLGDMDFKVTGTEKGITATQMDIKCDGLSYEVLEKALNQARDGRMHILNIIHDTIPEAREDYKPHVPRLVTLDIPKEMIGAVIGPQGKVIQGIQEETGTTISIDEDENTGLGHVEIASKDKASIDAALAKIKAIVAQPEEGEVYDGTVRSILDFGAFVEFMPGRDGLLHISEISWDRLDSMENSGLKEGDKIQVKLIEIDKKTGKYRLSTRVLTPKPEGYVEREARPRREGGDRGPRPQRNGDRAPRGDRGDRGPRNDRGDRGPRPQRTFTPRDKNNNED